MRLFPSVCNNNKSLQSIVWHSAIPSGPWPGIVYLITSIVSNCLLLFRDLLG